MQMGKNVMYAHDDIWSQEVNAGLVDGVIRKYLLDSM